MHRPTRSDAGDLSSPRSSRAPSFNSERPTLAGSTTFQMPSTIRPLPAYIAASVASQIVTDNHNAQLREQYGPNGDVSPFLVNALFSEQALCLLNAFLDHLLFAFLSAARSPSLTAIRPAITDILKPRLARDATATADEELQGLLAGEDDEEFPSAENGQGSAEAWDVDKVWKRTRLRIMVYTRLGELEDEDEERYVQQERGLSMDSTGDDEAGLVSWASAIFLTSVIEFIAEQTLMVSGTAAFARIAAKMKKNAQAAAAGGEPQLERIIVEDYDVEKVALNSALGRLWRTWRKRVRSPITPLTPRRITTARSFSSLASSHRRRTSNDTADGSTLTGYASVVPELPDHTITETDIAANIPLPMSDNDVAEIEVPGLARQYDGEGDGAQTPVQRPQRPTSFIMLDSPDSFKKRAGRGRPISMPQPEAKPFDFPRAPADDIQDLKTPREEFKTPMEQMDRESYIEDERQEGIYDHDGTSEYDVGTHEADMLAFAASTGVAPNMSPTKSRADEAEEEDTTEISLQSDYYAEPQVLQSKRMSIEKSGPPEMVRTYSISSKRSSPLLSPTEEERSYLDDHSDDEKAIGVARTSNVPIPSPSPPVEMRPKGPSPAPSKYPERGLLDNDPSRRLAAAPAMPPMMASPVDRSVAPDRSPSRNPSRATSSSSRAPALASLQENESHESPASAKKTGEPQRERSRGSKNGTPTRSREAAASAGERPGSRPSVEGAVRSRAETSEGHGEKTVLQRVSSSSSGGKSINTSILHSARGSDTSLGRPRGLSNRMSEEDRVREFDSLVKRDETVKFTLTPQGVREVDEPPVRRAETPKTFVKVYPAVSADKSNSFGSPPLPRKSSTRGQASSRSKTTGPKPLAREPRIEQDSMRDFADFIRSTGPAAGESRPVQPFVSLSQTRSKSPTTSTSSPLSSLSRKLSTRQTPISPPSASGSGEGPSARPRIHMEPRSPAGQRPGNDDLIDFIRQGPPGANNGQHRIPRTVAPFRNTVDSDQFDRMLDEPGNTESTYGSQVSTQSGRASANSRTGLLPAANVVQPAYPNTPQKLAPSYANADPEPQITRTRRRVKDPYAIDSDDDEDEDLLTALPKSNRRTQESLADFLNSAEPPPNNEPQPLNIHPATAALAIARAKSASNGKNGNNIRSQSGPSAAPIIDPRNGATAIGNGSAGHQGVNVTSIVSEAPRAHRPMLQARPAAAKDARAGRTATTDLADFLRTSGPPEPAVRPSSSMSKEKEGRRSGMKFWRRRAPSNAS
ncbi:hypothetical protein GQ43DRAFT_469869 [Delitschia confertaspora ATCC 74209]|uniref:Uncharacterized protein n=1 Tax=Delitschia confertaspora ATCC 74209 TaxID=1513339 RepID=A0A9P4JQA1_9PLEO|nr:hypothetical protein GQ43DRAFT_469869 [Delitschia confertaspora ATCC 74209]